MIVYQSIDTHALTCVLDAHDLADWDGEGAMGYRARIIEMLKDCALTTCALLSLPSLHVFINTAEGYGVEAWRIRIEYWLDILMPPPNERPDLPPRAVS